MFVFLKAVAKSMPSGGWLALVFDGSGKFFDLNHRTFFFLTLEFVRWLRETTISVTDVPMRLFYLQLSLGYEDN